MRERAHRRTIRAALVAALIVGSATAAHAQHRWTTQSAQELWSQVTCFQISPDGADVERLIAVVLRGRPDVPGLARHLNGVCGSRLTPLRIGHPILRDRVVVVQVSASEQIDPVLAFLRSQPWVERLGPVTAIDRRSVTFLTNEILIRFRARPSTGCLDALEAEHGLKRGRRLPLGSSELWMFRSDHGASRHLLQLVKSLEIGPTPSTVNQACGAARYERLILDARPNPITTAVDLQVTVPTCGGSTPDWHLGEIGTSEAWSLLAAADVAPKGGAPDVRVAVIDNGIWTGHDELGGHLTDGNPRIEDRRRHPTQDLIPGTTQPNPECDPYGTACSMMVSPHGTWVAGAIGSRVDDDQGASGVAPNVRLWNVVRPRPGTDLEYAEMFLWLAGVDLCAEQPSGTSCAYVAPPDPPADVLSCSFSRSTTDAEECTDNVVQLALQEVVGAGIPVFLAAGTPEEQAYSVEDFCWQSYDEVLVIGAVEAATGAEGLTHSSASRESCDVDLAAPTDVATPDSSGSTAYACLGETSGATPVAAGVAALMLSANPELTATEIRSILEETATSMGSSSSESCPGSRIDPQTGGQRSVSWSKKYGFGLIDAEAAVKKALMSRPPEPVPPADVDALHRSDDSGG